MILLGLVLIVPNARWVNEFENIRDYQWPSMFALPLNVIAILFVLTLANLLLRRSAPRWALSQAELLVLYSMLAVGSVIAGYSFVPLMLAWSVAPLARATVENGWEDLFLHLFPNWLVLKDERAVTTLLTGESSFWQASILKAWAAPLAGWTLFLLCFIGAMACVAVLVRRRWADEERLTFPVVKLPFELTRPDSGLLRNRLLWLGFGLSSMSALLSGLNVFYPAIPAIPKFLFFLGEYFQNPPWDAIGGPYTLPIRVHPWLVGFGMLMPQEVLFSYWFFFWFIQLQRVAVAALGWQLTPDFPYVPSQIGGAILAFAPAIIWSSRAYLKGVWRQAWGRPGGIDDSGEAISYRAALIGMLVCVSVMLGLLRVAGLSPWLGLAVLGIYFAFALTANRVRAEIGGPTNGVGLLYHDQLLVGMFGPAAFRPQDLALLSLTSWWGTAYQDPTPHQIEGLRLAQLGRFNMRKMLIALMLAAVVGIPAAYATLLGPIYKAGADTARSQFGIDHLNSASLTSYSRLQDWLSVGARSNPESSYQLVAMGGGFAFSLLLYALRARYLWWPFHPLGFVMAGSTWWASLFWPSIFVAWLTKSLLFRYGGRKTYVASLPLFFGFMLGDALMGGVWNIYGGIRNVFVFSVWD